ncbi:MAG: DNA polymerase III subunit beta [Pseudomonadales bacterium]
MKFSISRDELLKPLSVVVGVVERRQTLPILANVLITLNGRDLLICGTDLEVELRAHLALADDHSDMEDGQITVPARKLTDICKALPDGSDIQLQLDEQKLLLKSGRSRFTLATLPAADFPSVEDDKEQNEFELSQGQLKHLIERTGFAMAQQDVRYYLNGMLLEMRAGALRFVATDGHRLAMCTLRDLAGVNFERELILPRKGVMELSRLLLNEDQQIKIAIGRNHFRAETAEFRMTSKLVDGKFPDYDRVLPKNGDKVVHGTRSELRQAFSRAAILSNEKYRGVRLTLSNDTLQIVASNPEQEEAEVSVAVDYQGDELEVGFNVNYLLDVLAVVEDESVKLTLADSNSSALVEEANAEDSLYVVMPMRL